MRVLVTGATGFLGSHIAEELLASGYEVVALARDPAALDRDLVPFLSPPGGAPARLRVVRGALADGGALVEAVAGVDAVVHVAGLIQSATEAGYMRVNRDGTESLLRAVETAAPGLGRFVLVSSQAAGGPSRDGRPVGADQPARPVSAYGRSKLAGEERALARSAAIPVTILRPPVIFGPRDRMLAGMFRAVARGRVPVWGNGSNAFNVVHARDAARAAVLALRTGHPTGSILYTGDDRAFTWNSFLGLLATTAGARVRLVRLPAALFVAVAAASNSWAWLSGRPPLLSWDKLYELREPAWLCTSRRTQELLGWSPSLSVEQGLAETFAWYGERGLL